jgi:hypothetical protein
VKRTATSAAFRKLRARLGAYSQLAKYDSRETTRAARAAFEERFLNEVDPDRVLPELERLRRADAARRAYFTRLALQRKTKKTPAQGPSEAGKSIQPARQGDSGGS